MPASDPRLEVSLGPYVNVLAVHVRNVSSEDIGIYGVSFVRKDNSAGMYKPVERAENEPLAIDEVSRAFVAVDIGIWLQPLDRAEAGQPLQPGAERLWYVPFDWMPLVRSALAELPPKDFSVAVCGEGPALVTLPGQAIAEALEKMS